MATFITRFLCALPLLLFALTSAAISIPNDVLQKINTGQPVDLIIEYQTDSIEATAHTMRNKLPKRLDNNSVLQYKRSQYLSMKSQVDADVNRGDIRALKEYSHLPLSFKRFQSKHAVQALLNNPNIKAVYLNKTVHPVLTQSLPLINQSAVSSVGEQGVGTTVAVIDNGINIANSAFGTCTANVVSSGCKIIANVNIGSGTTNNNHGTNVSAIVAGVAPSAKIAMLNVFSGTSATFADVLAGINWAIANQAAYNIVAINMSLGDGSKNTTACSTNNPFLTPITNATNAGISVVVASGNEAYTNGISSPACTPGAISVGAVYDSNIGSVSWGSNLCSDSTTAADKVTCFSDSANFLTLLAPGAHITAGGITEGGTSQATPHVAGAVAVLRSTFPNETLAQTLARMTNTGKAIKDSRNNITKPRLNLLEAARPSNDTFANRITLAGGSGTTSGISQLATLESGEPNHANVVGAHSVWWKWVAPNSGQLSVDTHGSNFDTLLALYKGSSLTSLLPVASNDNDGAADNTSSVLFNVQAGTEYAIAVDGANSAQGSITLNWSLITNPVANLSVQLTGPVSTPTGTYVYTLNISNAGPQTATHAVAAVSLPSSATLIHLDSACSVNAGILTCQAGTLASNASKSFTFEVAWGSVLATDTLTASVSSDLNDSSSADNTVTISPFANLVDDTGNDVPLLPPWGYAVLAVFLFGLSVRRTKPP